MERNKEQNKIQSIQQNNDTKTQVELITEKLEAGMTEIMSDGGKYEDYLRTISKFHRYSLNNTMLIYMQNPEASYVDQGFQCAHCDGALVLRVSSIFGRRSFIDMLRRGRMG